VALYQGDFNPLSPTDNLVFELAENANQSQSFGFDLLAATSYTIVVSPIGITNNNLTCIVESDGPAILNTDGFTFEGRETGPQGMVPLTDGNFYEANKVCPDVDGWRHYYYSDANNPGQDYILLSVQDYPDLALQSSAAFAKSGGSSGATTLTNPPADYISTTNWTVMNRHWSFDIPANLQPENLTDIRFYYTQDDLDALATAVGNSSLDHEDLQFSKINDAANVYDINPVNLHVGIPAAAHCADEGIWAYRPGISSDSTTWLGGIHQGGFYAQMQVHSFSGGGAGIGSFSEIVDADNDGFTNEFDCNDNNPLINPDQTEILYNGIDDDCNSLTLDDDLDQDGFVLADDCDDENPDINPASNDRNAIQWI